MLSSLISFGKKPDPDDHTMNALASRSANPVRTTHGAAPLAQLLNSDDVEPTPSKRSINRHSSREPATIHAAQNGTEVIAAAIEAVPFRNQSPLAPPSRSDPYAFVDGDGAASTVSARLPPKVLKTTRTKPVYERDAMAIDDVQGGVDVKKDGATDNSTITSETDDPQSIAAVGEMAGAEEGQHFQFEGIDDHRWAQDHIELFVRWTHGEPSWVDEYILHDDCLPELLSYWKTLGGRPTNPHGEDLYNIFDIVADRKAGKDLLIEWVGFPKAQNTWEPRRNIEKTDQEAVKEYFAKKGTTRSSRGRPKKHRPAPQDRRKRKGLARRKKGH